MWSLFLQKLLLLWKIVCFSVCFIPPRSEHSSQVNSRFGAIFALMIYMETNTQPASGRLERQLLGLEHVALALRSFTRANKQ
jgi:hypothetical protein